MLLTLWFLGYIELYFADEFGFNLNLYLPYAWQKKKQTQRILARKRGKRLNVFGLMSLAGLLTVYRRETPIDGEFIKTSLADFDAKPYEKLRVVILDNGPVRHAKVVKDELEGWESVDMVLFYLPTYSPHLNPIEILWRFCKYKWLNKASYKSWSKLKKAIFAIFKSYGSICQIDFKKIIAKNTVSNAKVNFT